MTREPILHRPLLASVCHMLRTLCDWSIANSSSRPSRLRTDFSVYFANPDPVDYYYMFVLIDETKWVGQPEIVPVVGSRACNPSR
jgi:hypothetical protein